MKNEIKKTVVPQFVAEWFEENKWDLEYEIYNVITEIFSKDSSEYSRIEQWFDSNFWNGKNNYPIETVVRMQDGYTIEKESKYIVRFPDSKFDTPSYGTIVKIYDKKKMAVISGVNIIPYKYTEEEIKEVGERYWQFAEKVEE